MIFYAILRNFTQVSEKTKLEREIESCHQKMLEIERENDGDATGIMPWQTDADLVKLKLKL